MLCRMPYRKGVMEYGCGQCLPCRINKSRLWVGRMLLELGDHEQAAFVTLTYDDKHLPKDGSVSKKTLQEFLKRLRWNLQGRSIRYFGVGEYGTLSWRPHYHLIIFGLSPTEEQIVKRSWLMKGFVHVGTAEAQSMAYVCSYLLKNMKKKLDPRLQGRVPEFSLMSKRPGLGFGIVKKLVESYKTHSGKLVLKQQGWFGERVRIGKTIYPLGRYLMDKVQEDLKLDKAQKKVYNRNKMFEVYARKSKETTTVYEKKRKAKVTAQMGRVKQMSATI